MKVSVVIPVYNEEENVIELYQRIVKAFTSGPHTLEILFVDDGSRDRTVPFLRSLQEQDDRLRIVKLRRNCGQTPSMRAGIDFATGDVIVTMDGDLQNDPEDIPRMLDRLGEGFDLVAGWRRNRQDAWLSRKLPSRIANAIIARVTGVRIRDNGCSLKAFRAEVIKETPLYSELHRFIPAMITAAGGRIAEVAVTHHPRLHGQSKYGISRTMKVLLDMVTVKMLLVFSHRPLQWFGMLAVAPALLCVLCTAYAIVLNSVSQSRSVTVVYPTAAFLFGYLAIHLVVIGFLGELIVRTGKRFEFRSSSRVTVPPRFEGV